MRSVLTILVILLIVLSGGGLVVISINKVRQSAHLTMCQNNLKMIGMGLGSYLDQHKRFPNGTFMNPELPPSKRFNWLIEIYPGELEAGAVLLLDKTKAWDSPENCPPRGKVINCNDLTVAHDEHVWGEVEVFLCPINPKRKEPSMPSLTHYIGIAGIGENAGELPVFDPSAGLFGFDRKVTLEDLKHGQATTIAMAETLDGAPWTAGGQATIRGLYQAPYMGAGGQFSSNHGAGTNVLFADGSVRVFTSAASAQMLHAMATLAGDADIARFDD